MWTESERDLLLDMKRTCLVHMFLQSGSAYLNHILHNALTFPNIAISAVISAYLFGSNNPEWHTASGVLAITSTVITSLARHLQPGEKAQLHCSAMQNYQSLIHDINLRLHVDMNDRDRAEFLQFVKNDLDKMFRMQPEPSVLVVRAFEKKYKNSIENMLYEEFERVVHRVSQKISRIHVSKGARAKPSAGRELMQVIVDADPFYAIREEPDLERGSSANTSVHAYTRRIPLEQESCPESASSRKGAGATALSSHDGRDRV